MASATPSIRISTEARRGHAGELSSSRSRQPLGQLQARRRDSRSRQRRLLPRRSRRDAGAGRRIGRGKIGDGACLDEAPAAHSNDRQGEPDHIRRDAHRPIQRAADAGAARRSHHHDLPGADVDAQSGLPDQHANLRIAHPPPGSHETASARSRARSPQGGAHRRSGGAPRAVPASALRRPAPAGDDRDRHRQQSRATHRRRADDGARRDGAGRDPQAHPQSAGRLPDGRGPWSPTISRSSRR